jgi:hypothetical protein
MSSKQNLVQFDVFCTSLLATLTVKSNSDPLPFGNLEQNGAHQNVRPLRANLERILVQKSQLNSQQPDRAYFMVKLNMVSTKLLLQHYCFYITGRYTRGNDRAL